MQEIPPQVLVTLIEKDTIATERPGLVLNKGGPVALTGSRSCKKS